VADAVFSRIERSGVNLHGRRTPFVHAGTAIPGARFRKFQSPADVVVRAPAAWEDGETDRYSKLWQRVARGYPVYAGGVLDLTDARFHLPSGTIAVGGRFPAETIELLDFPFRWQYLDAVRALWAPARRVGDGYLMTLQQSSNYYHWVCEILPLVFTLRQDAQWGQLPVYMAAELPAFVFQYLRLLELDRHCRMLPRGVYVADSLRVPTFPGLAESPSPEHLLRLRSACLEAVGPATGPRRRLYVSRADAQGRRVANEAALMAALAPLGFESVTLSGKSAIEQIRLFQSADIIVAPHGAGNTNILFAPEDCIVMELLGPSLYSWCYMAVASAIGQVYGYLGCAETGVDLVVDPALSRSVLERLIEARKSIRLGD